MKKALLVIFIASTLAPTTTFAQKKKDKKKDNKQTEQTVTTQTIQSQSDTISYAFGASISEGLSQYLTQQNVLVDTLSIRSEYQSRIENEMDAKKKTALQKQLSNSLDSANNINAINRQRFLEGVSNTLLSSNDAAYEAGVNIAAQLRQVLDRFSQDALYEGESIDMQKFFMGFSASFNGEKSAVNNPYEYINSLIEKKMTSKREAEKEALKAEYASEIEAGNKFMSENGSKPGVVTLPSGLQYKPLTTGTGITPKDGEKVKVHYQGTLIDGTVFDSSVERGEPIEFHVGQLIKGWNEALTLMPEGSKWVLYIPYDLAYGSADKGIIRPFSNLIFEVELIKVGD